MPYRHGGWMQTYTGRKFWPMDPRADEVFIEDIAHSLSMQCRYAGHSIRFYSVAEHCVHIAHYLAMKWSPTMALSGLMHDASEAYLVDVPRPVKPHLGGYGEAEDRVSRIVSQRFCLPQAIPDQVHRADRRILLDEREQNMTQTEDDWGVDGDPLGITLRCWSPGLAEQEFLAAFKKYGGEQYDER